MDRDDDRKKYFGTLVVLAKVEVMDAAGARLAETVFRPAELSSGRPGTSSNYFKARDKWEERWCNGYLRSDDVGRVDTKGELQITDRTEVY